MRVRGKELKEHVVEWNDVVTAAVERREVLVSSNYVAKERCIEVYKKEKG